MAGIGCACEQGARNVANRKMHPAEIILSIAISLCLGSPHFVRHAFGETSFYTIRETKGGFSEPTKRRMKQ